MRNEKGLKITEKRLTHGFRYGVNNITFTKINKWTSCRFDDFGGLVDYLKNNKVDVVELGRAWLKVRLKSERDVHILYSTVMKYYRKGSVVG